MDYSKHYELLCKRGQVRKLQGVYTEVHHIIPKCLGGTEKPENLTTLTAREHFVAHWLLSRIHPEDRKIQLAFKMMCDVNYGRRYVPSSRAIAEARKNAAQLHSKHQKGKPRVELWGEEKAKAVSAQVSKTKTGHKTSEETKKKISQSLTNVPRPKIKNRVHINNKKESRMVHAELLDSYLEQGWSRGRLPESDTTKNKRKETCKGRCWITNGQTKLLIKKTDIDAYINQGYILKTKTNK